MSRLTNNNRERHQLVFHRLFSHIVTSGRRIKNIKAGTFITNWRWPPIGKRLGYQRSADGVVFELGEDKVAKFIFSEDTSPINEIRIGIKAGDAGIGPKIYAAYAADVSGNLLSNFAKSEPRELNIFQNFENTPMNKKGFLLMFIIIMERMHGFTLNEVLRDVPGTEKIRVSYYEFLILLSKLHSLGIIHADMHPGNIFVEIKKGHTRLKLIDFGRSYNVNRPLTTNNANTYMINRGKYMEYIPTLNGIPSHVVSNVNGLPRYRNKAAFENAYIKISSKYRNRNRRNKIIETRRTKVKVKKTKQHKTRPVIIKRRGLKKVIQINEAIPMSFNQIRYK